MNPTDYIARQDAINALVFPKNAPAINVVFADIINRVPAADVVPVKHGRWIGDYDGYADGFPVYDMWSCSVCGWDCDGVDEEPTWIYYPNCGARMDGDGE